MLVKTIMIHGKDLKCLSVNETIKDAIEHIDSCGLLSMPVVDGKKFVGILSKEFIYENYYKSSEQQREDYLKKLVGEFIITKIPTVSGNINIEDAADLFLNSNLRFIPVTKEDDTLLGIITHKALFRDYQKIFGLKLPKIIIYTYDIKGVLAKITDIVAKEDGNIKNIVQKDTEIMGTQEITLRIDCKDIKRIVKALNNNGIQVRYFSEN